MSPLGIDTENTSIDNLVAGEIKTLALPVAGSLGEVAVGQVYVYNGSTHKWDKYVSGHTGKYAVGYEAANITDARNLVCIVKGEINIGALDTTSKADLDIVAGLLMNGIIARTAQPA